jgi:proline racemase
VSIPTVSTTDYHTAGEPFRIVADPPVSINGATVAERRIFAINDPHVDDLRKLLCFEPRGHADMYGGFITPPDDAGQTLIHDSIVRTRFHARIVEEVCVAQRRAVIPEVSGMAFRTGQHTFHLDPADELRTGFVLR